MPLRFICGTEKDENRTKTNTLFEFNFVFYVVNLTVDCHAATTSRSFEIYSYLIIAVIVVILLSVRDRNVLVNLLPFDFWTVEKSKEFDDDASIINTVVVEEG